MLYQDIVVAIFSEKVFSNFAYKYIFIYINISIFRSIYRQLTMLATKSLIYLSLWWIFELEYIFHTMYAISTIHDYLTKHNRLTLNHYKLENQRISFCPCGTSAMQHRYYQGCMSSAPHNRDIIINSTHPANLTRKALLNYSWYN